MTLLEGTSSTGTNSFPNSIIEAVAICFADRFLASQTPLEVPNGQ